MNVFRLVADGSHVLAVVVLTFKLFCTRSSAAGVSWKSLFLYAATYAARYTDLLTTFFSFYNSSLKIFFIITSIVPVLFLPWILRESYQKKFDTFWIELLILPVTALSLLVNHEKSISEICWTWSIYMEAVAMLPQFYMTFRGGHVDRLLLAYIGGMFLYRGFYIGNWVYRYYTEGYYDLIAIGGGFTESFLGLYGLISLIILYRIRCKESAVSYFSVNVPSSVYTVSLVASEEKSSKVPSTFPSSGLGDTESLLKMIEEDPVTQGPYNPELSIPIGKGATFVA